MPRSRRRRRYWPRSRQAPHWTSATATPCSPNRVETFRVLAGSAYPEDGVSDALFGEESDHAISFPSTLNHGPAIAESESWHERLDGLDIPTLIIHRDEDPILTYDRGQALHAAISGSRMLTLPGVEHELPRGV